MCLPREIMDRATVRVLPPPLTGESCWRLRFRSTSCRHRRLTRRSADRGGTLLTAGAPIATVAAKQAAFRETGAVAVDMESAAVAQLAALHALPFIAVRVIVDTATDAVPPAVEAASRAGRLRMRRLVWGLMLAPAELGSSDPAGAPLSRCHALALGAVARTACAGLTRALRTA